MAEIQGYGAAPQTGDDPRWIAIRVSRINLAVTLLGAVLAVPMLFVVPIPPVVRAVLLVLFLMAMAIDLLLALLILPTSVMAFQLSGPEALPAAAGTGVRPALAVRIRQRGRTGTLEQPVKDATVLAGSFVTPWLTVIRYRLPGDLAWRRAWPRVIPIWPDSIPTEDFRRTRVALKWK